ncbi:hypothetical protein [Rhizobium mongolense]|uniref:Uncharacterized protein n=2 Tax=Rhizobium mongolense TaxID=57676 RepID=A0ABR6IQA8_9HYPH|nr:hypothetical protein [Rhizobium mongolense]MBB4230067.1 hypothetical protein [Rhizobium mongolense]TVZ72802.1 hypothetical protein BCL32_0989 [Rhizobium mongolense USDA 1844]
MALYENCDMTVFFSDEEPMAVYRCDVRIGDGTIVVSYDSENGTVVYRGNEVAPGHFKLSTLDVVKGRATLHCFEQSTRLEGTWQEDGARGMWYIDLSEED